MTSILSVTTPASDLKLLTIAQLRAAIGASDQGHDATIIDLGVRAAATIAAACRVRAAAGVPPTLRQEVLSETFRLRARAESLRLARWPVTELASVTEAGDLLAGSDYELAGASGTVYRLSNDIRRPWTQGRCCGELKVVVAYTAGWATVPDDLVRAAQRLVKHFYDTDGQEANLRIDYNEGVNRTEFFASPGEVLLPPDVDALLGPYKNLSF